MHDHHCFPGESSRATLDAASYVVCSVALAVPLVLSVYFAVTGRKQNTSSSYLSSDRQIRTFPLATSLASSYISPIVLLGCSSTVFNHGTQIWLIWLGYAGMLPVVTHACLPVFHQLQCTSVHEYLEKRFDKCVRILASSMFACQTLFYLAAVVYVTGHALKLVGGFDSSLGVLVIFSIGIIYTTLGGMKAVMWSNTFHLMVAVAGILGVAVKGHINVVETENKTLWVEDFEFFNTDDNLLITQYNFWSVIIGGSFLFANLYTCNQIQVQQYLSAPLLSHAQRAVGINMVSLILVITTCCYGGLMMLATFHERAQNLSQICRNDLQLFTVFAKETVGDTPALTGLYLAGIICGSLSAVTCGIISLPTVGVSDFPAWCGKDCSEQASARLSRIGTVLSGLVLIVLAVCVERLEAAFQMSIRIQDTLGGIILGLFSLGLFVPWANVVGALVGLLLSLGVMCWLLVGHIVSIPAEQNDSATIVYSDHIFPLQKLSYLWYTPIGWGVTVVVGLIVSLLTRSFHRPSLESDLFPPITKWFYKFITGRHLGHECRDEAADDEFQFENPRSFCSNEWGRRGQERKNSNHRLSATESLLDS